MTDEDTKPGEGQPVRTSRVFVPNGTPSETYVSRQDLEQDVDTALEQVGTQLLVAGPSATGKTTLVRKRLASQERVHKPISVNWRPQTSFLVLIKTLLREYYSTGNQHAKNLTEIKGLRSETLALKILEKCVESDPRPIFIDDVRSADVSNLADLAKQFSDWATAFSDERLMLITIGLDLTIDDFSAARAKEVVRIAPVKVSTFEESELRTLITQGGAALNVDFSEEVTAYIIGISGGNPRACQALCYHLCLRNGVTETVDHMVRLDDKLFDAAVKCYFRHEGATALGNIKKCLKMDLGGIRSADVFGAICKLQSDAGDNFAQNSEISIDDLVRYLKDLYQFLGEEKIEQATNALARSGHGIIYVSRARKVSFIEPVYKVGYQSTTQKPGGVTATKASQWATKMARALTRKSR